MEKKIIGFVFFSLFQGVVIVKNNPFGAVVFFIGFTCHGLAYIFFVPVRSEANLSSRFHQIANSLDTIGFLIKAFLK